MVGQRVEDLFHYLKLNPDDIPQAVGLFVAAKYATLGAGIAVGLRYQPFRRLALGRSLVLKSSPWAQEQRTRVIEAFDRVKAYHRIHVGGTSAHRQRARLLEALSRAKQSPMASDVVDSAKAQIRSAKAKFRDARGRWKRAGQKLLLKKQIEYQHKKYWLAKVLAQHSWHGWLSKKYWHLADRLEMAASRNYLFLLLSRSIGLMPKTLAVGIAEGVLLSKLLLPFTAPLSLLLFVFMYKRRDTWVVTSAEEFEEIAQGDSESE